MDNKRIGCIGRMTGCFLISAPTLRCELVEHIPQTPQFIGIEILIGMLVVSFPQP